MILCMMRIPPAADGHGGSQRAWALVKALASIAPVHFVLLSRRCDVDARTVSLEPLKAIAETITSIDVPEWQPLERTALDWLSPRAADWANLLKSRCQEAPRLSAGALLDIAGQLPVRSAKVLFAGRVPTATIADQLIRQGLLQVDAKAVDLDDIMSRFRLRQVRTESARMGRHWTFLHKLDARLIEQAERRVCLNWDAVSVCSDDDVAALRVAYPRARVMKVPNVIDRSLLPPRAPDGVTRVLFVGNLGFAANVSGLETFVAQAWPRIRARRPDARLVIVGMNPMNVVQRIAEAEDVELHANVPDLEPYYRDSDMVIAPILFGGGTRIKILEAMAYGRPVVATSVGAEGLAITPGVHALVADRMEDFAAAVVRLAEEPQTREGLVAKASRLQRESYGPEELARAVREMVRMPASTLAA